MQPKMVSDPTSFRSRMKVTDSSATILVRDRHKDYDGATDDTEREANRENPHWLDGYLEQPGRPDFRLHTPFSVLDIAMSEALQLQT